MEGQGPHVGGDDVPLGVVEVKPGLSVGQGVEGVVEGVVSAGAGAGLPIVEEEVVEQAAPCRRAGVQTQGGADAEAGVGHQAAVVVGAHPFGVLGEEAHGLHVGVGLQIGHTGEVLGGVFEIPHGVHTPLFIRFSM